MNIVAVEDDTGDVPAAHSRSHPQCPDAELGVPVLVHGEAWDAAGGQVQDVDQTGAHLDLVDGEVRWQS